MSKLERTCKILEACEHETWTLRKISCHLHMGAGRLYPLLHEMATSNLMEILTEHRKKKNGSGRCRLSRDPATYVRKTYRIAPRGLEVLKCWKELQSRYKEQGD